jgi:hypothetical protein
MGLHNDNSCERIASITQRLFGSTDPMERRVNALGYDHGDTKADTANQRRDVHRVHEADNDIWSRNAHLSLDAKESRDDAIESPEAATPELVNADLVEGIRQRKKRAGVDAFQRQEGNLMAVSKVVDKV